jgi:predicted AlkP superfamily pyrophosphatase or phosphodiesterase
MINVAPTVSEILGLQAPMESIGSPIQEIVQDLQKISKVTILAPDAFGDFAWKLWQDKMPFLKSLHSKRSVILNSVMPSITPVNFATMVTGTTLKGHGVNTLREDFRCDTLFDVIRRSGEKSAAVGLDGYTGSELLGRFADISGNAGKGSDDDVMIKIIEIIDKHKPKFLIAQMGRVDDVFHKYGPSSPSVVPMLKDTDIRLKRLVKHLKPLGYGIIILSDHGQHDVIDNKENELKGSHGTDMPADCNVPCTWI